MSSVQHAEAWKLLQIISSAAANHKLIEEGHLMPDHVHMMISIPPKYAVSQLR